MKSITIQDIRLYPIALPYKSPFKTSFGESTHKVAVLIEVITESGVHGWGEASVELNPGYGAETMETALHILKNFLIPCLHNKTLNHPLEADQHLKPVRGNPNARAGLEIAVWDTFAKTNDMRLVDLLALNMPDGHKSRGYANVGVSVGLQKTIESTIQTVQNYINDGYQRIKLKIKPGEDVELVKAIRGAFPDVLLMADANSAYTLDDADHLKQLDEFDLLMIEQPLAYNDIHQHSQLQRQLNTRICLDESVKSISDLEVAIAVGAIGVLNLKPARVGGFAESLKIYHTCTRENLPLWVGGMLETGVGRAAIASFASFPNVTLPCDISATDRYFEQDISEPPFVLGDNSTIPVPDGYGIGVEVQCDRLESAEATWHKLNPYR